MEKHLRDLILYCLITSITSIINRTCNIHTLTGAFTLSAAFSSASVGRYVDYYRNLLHTSMFIGMFNLACNVLYILPYSNLLPIFGRFSCGIAEGIKSAYIGGLVLTFATTCFFWKS